MKTMVDFMRHRLTRALAKTCFRLTVDAVERIPADTPAVVALNSVSFIDAFLASAALPRPALFLVDKQELGQTRFGPLLRLCGVTGVDFGNPAESEAAFKHAGRVLSNRGLVAVFPEGKITRTGFLGSFSDRCAVLAARFACPVVPLCIDYMRGSRQNVFGRDSVRLGAALRTRVSIVCGAPCESGISSFELRRRMEELSARAYELRKPHRRSLGCTMIRTARRNWFRDALSDTTGTRASFGKALAGSCALAAAFRRNFPEQSALGVVMPASVGAALVNVGIVLAGKVPVNLNFTTAPENIAHAARTCGIKTVVTSRQFVRKLENLVIPGKPVYLEDLMRKIGRIDRFVALIKACFVPAAILSRERARCADACATIVFSSGSTAEPKGIVLTHHNIISNIEQMHTVIDLCRRDCMCGVLPFFHSFGLTATLWFPLVAGFRAAYHPNPLDGSTIASLVRNEKATLLLATPTFLHTYLRKAKPGDFDSIRIIISGAEKLKPSLAQAFKEKLGVLPLEGYGATELSPVACLNVLDSTHWGITQKGSAAGAVGRLLPGMCGKVVDPETGAPCGENRPGILIVKGPNVMQGYLNMPEETKEVLKDGWYTTGDIVSISADGFVTLTDRLSRFSKIGGEMVPHAAVEDIFINALHAGDPVIAVTAVPDASRGEKLIVVYTKDAGTADALRSIMESSTVPNLWRPAADAYVLVDEIPMLGTGKTDLKAVRARAQAAVTGSGVCVGC
jgi:acyl-[acyl-carrier-protein]-phospholipid O-acyltransferase/long-chain-fatty-acid--[acyl-carrier-protein] ligase